MAASKKANRSVIWLKEANVAVGVDKEKSRGRLFPLSSSFPKGQLLTVASELFNKSVEKFVEKAYSAGVRAHTANTLRSLH